MEQDAQIVLRVPQEMADRLKGFAAKLSREFGVPVSLASAARRFIAEGLAQAGYPEGTPPPTDVPVSRPAPRRGAVKAKGEAARAAKTKARREAGTRAAKSRWHADDAPTSKAAEDPGEPKPARARKAKAR